MVSIDISNVHVVLSTDDVTTSPHSLPGIDAFPSESASDYPLYRRPVPRLMLKWANPFRQGHRDTTPVPVNRPVIIDVDKEATSSTPYPVKTASKTGFWPSLADTLKGQEEFRKDKAKT